MTTQKKNIRIGIVAGELSGDLLGTGLIRAIRAQYPDAVIEGIAGPGMQGQGCHSFFPLEKLSVMGIFEVLMHVREILSIRKFLLSHFLANPPDVFIGIDAPDFNLPLERKLKEAGIKTVHYVSPSVWAWRQGRVHGIRKSVDLMLTFLPFEADFYREHQVPVEFVGHPLADEIPFYTDKKEMRDRLGIDRLGEVTALLPGSRMGEVSRLAPIFFAAAQSCYSQCPTMQFCVAAPTEKIALYLEALRQSFAALPIRIFRQDARTLIGASDWVMATSGTVTLEAMLVNRPMVVAYKIAWPTYFLVQMLGLLKIQYFSLPNLLNGTPIVSEFMQGEATPEHLTAALLSLRSHPQDCLRLEARFRELHACVQKGASLKAAEAVLRLFSCGETNVSN